MPGTLDLGSVLSGFLASSKSVRDVPTTRHGVRVRSSRRPVCCLCCAVAVPVVLHRRSHGPDVHGPRMTRPCMPGPWCPRRGFSRLSDMVAANKTGIALPDSFTPLQRVLLTANGNFELLVSSYVRPDLSTACP